MDLQHDEMLHWGVLAEQWMRVCTMHWFIASLQTHANVLTLNSDLDILSKQEVDNLQMAYWFFRNQILFFSVG